MATIQGKAYWASITRPNTTFDPVYQIDLAIDDETADQFSAKGITVKEDERGKVVKFKRRVSRADGTDNPQPKLVDSSKNPGVGLDLQAVQVISLIPYGEEFDKVDGFVATDSVDEF